MGEEKVGVDGLYRAAVRIVMRLVTVMFAEERRLLPVGNRFYDASYSLSTLSDRLADAAVRAPGGLAAHYTAWPALCALFRLIYEGSSHPALASRAYGGELFRPAKSDSADEGERALAMFERPCHCPDDLAVSRILSALQCAVGQGGEGRFARTQFIGSLYEALLDYSLKRAAAGETLLVLNNPRRTVVPLSILESLPDDKLRKLLSVKVAARRSRQSEKEPSASDETPGQESGQESASKARQWARAVGLRLGVAGPLFVDHIRPGELYLVRHDGTRKSGGVFYTPSTLTAPTVRRVLEPLCRSQGGEVRTPEEILGLKVCDPAMGSGSFLVAALGFLTGQMLGALKAHGRLTPMTGEEGKGGATLVSLRPGLEFDLPGRPGEPEFDGLLEAHAKRHVVENCIYGVDLDALTVELARLSLWLETMDHRLPFTFLDHKLKCGNSLIGCRYEDLPVYPAAAWKRGGGDLSHREGVHYPPRRRTNKLKQKAQSVASEMAMVINEARSPLLPFVKDRHRIESFQRSLGQLMQEIHFLPVQLPDRKRELYRRSFVNSSAVQEMRNRLDNWCRLWFWKAEEAGDAPGPLDFYRHQGRSMNNKRGAGRATSFFHWQLEFPDVFKDRKGGFDALLANPPWDVAKPGAGEFFPRHDPVYRILRAGEAGAVRRQLFERSPEVEKEWLDYNEQFRALSNWFLNSHQPAGRFENALNAALSVGGESALRPFRRQGAADINKYKLFTEMAHSLCRDGGRLGLVLPSGIYSDRGTSALRELLVNECRLEWLVGFENKKGVFDIHRSFKFCVLVAEKGGATQAVKAAFMVREPSAWERGEEIAFPYPLAAARAVSPEFGAFAEVNSPRHLEVLAALLKRGTRLFPPAGAWQGRYAREFDSGNASDTLKSVEWWEKRGFAPDETGLWRRGDEVAYPVTHGAMVGQFEPFKQPRPRFLMADEQYAASGKAVPGPKVAVRRIARNTDVRTAIAAIVPDVPCSDNAAVLQVGSSLEALALVGALNSFCVDFAARTICSGTHLDRHHLARLPLPFPDAPGMRDTLPLLCLRLNCGHAAFSSLWLEMLAHFPHLADRPWQEWWAKSPHERLRLRCMADALVATAFGLTGHELHHILSECEHPSGELASPGFAGSLAPSGFWRVDKDRDPELRHSVLVREALESLTEWGTDRVAEWDWQLPDTLTLRGRAFRVRERMGPQLLPQQEKTFQPGGWDECRRLAEQIQSDREKLDGLRRDARGASIPTLIADVGG